MLSVQFVFHALCEKQLSTKVDFAPGSASHIDFQHDCNDCGVRLITCPLSRLLVSVASCVQFKRKVM